MTPEERAQIEQERRELVARISTLERNITAAQIEQVELKQDLQYCIKQLGLLERQASAMGEVVRADMGRLNDRLKRESLDARDLLQLLRDVSERYFSYKNLSTATKNLTQFNDEYFTKYRFYHELRRISLGCVMAVDTNLIHQDRARKAVEKSYLANTEYWLAYATMAVMLWWSDEREAAQRATSKALTLSGRRAALMFLFCNLRFGRKESALKWYNYYLDRIRANNVGTEFQYLLEANLTGAFGGAHALQTQVNARIDAMVDEIGATQPQFQSQVAQAAARSIITMPHVSDFEYFYLPDYCAQCPDQRQLLDNAQKIGLAARDLQDVSRIPERAEGVSERLEDAVYSVMNAMDPKEEELYRRIRYNEMVVGAKGDLAVAQRAYAERYPSDERVTFGDLLMQWAFSDGDSTVLPQTRRFAVTHIADGMREGYAKYVQDLRGQERERYTIKVDDWQRDCTEFEGDSAKASYSEHFNSHRLRYFLSDKWTLIYVLVMVASVIGIVVCAFTWLHPAPIIIGALLLLGAGFALWLRIHTLSEILEQRRRKSLEIIDRTLAELGRWRTALHKALDDQAVLNQAFDLFA